MSKFKVGQKVKVTDRYGSKGPGFKAGDVFVIESYTGGFGDAPLVTISREGRAFIPSGGGGYSENWFDPVDETEPETPAPKFKVGDRVRVVNNVDPEGFKLAVAVGTIGTVVEVDTDDKGAPADDIPYYVRYEDYYGEDYFAAEQLELAPALNGAKAFVVLDDRATALETLRSLATTAANENVRLAAAEALLRSSRGEL